MFQSIAGFLDAAVITEVELSNCPPPPDSALDDFLEDQEIPDILKDRDVPASPMIPAVPPASNAAVAQTDASTESLRIGNNEPAKLYPVISDLPIQKGSSLSRNMVAMLHEFLSSFGNIAKPIIVPQVRSLSRVGNSETYSCTGSASCSI